ncbi:MAG: hypothetical protein M0T74_15630 [Desulfitobacterium hafniense]|nr:hypothetical protein [Desulfitobacterium hafniense]
MGKREVASLACKILGLYTIVDAVTVIARVIFFMATTRNNSSNPSFFMNQEILNIVSFVLLGIFGLVLWLVSDKLAKIMVSDSWVKPDSSQGSFTIQEIQSVAISTLGLYFLGTAIPKFTSSMFNLARIQGEIDRVVHSGIIVPLVESLIQLLLGLVLFLGARGIAGMLKQLRQAGVKDPKDYE